MLTANEEQVRTAGPGLQMVFLIDRGGVIRWRWIEAAEQARDRGLLLAMSRLLTEVGATVEAHMCLVDNAFHLTGWLAFARPPAGECERSMPRETP